MQSPHTEAIITRHLRDLFKQLPALSGFRLRVDLAVSDVSMCGPAPRHATQGLYPLVMQSIVELAECHPEALQHMRQRTFARSQYGGRGLSDDIATVC